MNRAIPEQVNVKPAEADQDYCGDNESERGPKERALERRAARATVTGIAWVRETISWELK